MGCSETLFDRAQRVIPGGVNSPVRAFRAVDMTPRFITSAQGCHMTDADGVEYVDFVGSWGPMLLGHAHPAVVEAVRAAALEGLSFGAATTREVEMAELVCALVPSVELVRMVNSGTEAVMGAIRAARGFTGREKVIKFDGCYHGHSDGLLVQAGSGVMTAGAPDSAGVPAGCTRSTLSACYNDLESVRARFRTNPGEIAAVIVEPVAANMGVVPPAAGFLKGLRTLCNENGSLLIFDEVITGFRLSLAGAQGYYGVRPDLTTFGKIIGGGMPVGAYGGRRDVMETVAPLGPVYQAGTLSGNPVAMAAGLAQLRLLRDEPGVYRQLEAVSDAFFDEVAGRLHRAGEECQVNHVGSLGSIFFTAESVRDYASARTADTARFRSYAQYMFRHGIYVAPSQFEAMFLSAAHTQTDLEKALSALDAWLKCR